MHHLAPSKAPLPCPLRERVRVPRGPAPCHSGPSAPYEGEGRAQPTEPPGRGLPRPRPRCKTPSAPHLGRHGFTIDMYTISAAPAQTAKPNTSPFLPAEHQPRSAGAPRHPALRKAPASCCSETGEPSLGNRGCAVLHLRGWDSGWASARSLMRASIHTPSLKNVLPREVQ